MAYILLIPILFLTGLGGYSLALNPASRRVRTLVLYTWTEALSLSGSLILHTSNVRAAAVALGVWAFLSLLVAPFLGALLAAYVAFQRPFQHWRVRITIGLLVIMGVLLGAFLVFDLLAATHRILPVPEPLPEGGGRIIRAPLLAPYLVAYWFFAVLSTWILLLAAWRNPERVDRLSVGLVLAALILSVVMRVPAVLLGMREFALLGEGIASTFTVVAFTVAIFRQFFTPAAIVLELAIQLAGRGMVIVDRNGVVTRINVRALRMLEVPEWAARRELAVHLFGLWRDQVTPQAPFLEFLEVLERGEFVPMQFEIERDRGGVGKHQHFEITLTPLLSRRGKPMGALIAIADRTEERYREESLQESLERVERLADTVRELASPVIPITDRTIVLPLVGFVDAQRMEEIERALLEGVSAYRPYVAILDLTGVPLFEEEAIPRLVQSIHSASLLGARCVIVGMQPEIAATFADSGVELLAESLPDLQTAIAYAERVGSGGRSR